MESTPDCRRIWFCLLEPAGLTVQPVNSRQARQLAGRPETGQEDAQRIARPAGTGLLRPSFVPPPQIRALRDLTRTRLQPAKDRTRERQRPQKLPRTRLERRRLLRNLTRHRPHRPASPAQQDVNLHIAVPRLNLLTAGYLRTIPRRRRRGIRPPITRYPRPTRIPPPLTRNPAQSQTGTAWLPAPPTTGRQAP
jgi:hypothetical protein